MRFRLIPLMLLCIVLGAWDYGRAQNTTTLTQSGTPTGGCAFVLFNIDSSTGKFYNCFNNAWHLVGPGAAGAAAWDSLTNPTTGTLSLVQFANGNDFWIVKRNTDTGPTGSFFRFQTSGGTDLCKLDITGAFSSCLFPYANLTGTPSTFNPSAHNLLSAAHGDTTAASVSRGAGIFGIGASPTWSLVAAPGVTGGYFKLNASGDIVASTLAASGTGSPTACSNQVVTAFTLNADAAPTSTCATITSAFTTGTFPANAHNLLSGTHGDTVAHAVVLGDLIYGNSTPAWQALAGNTTSTKKFLTQTGTGSVSAAPAWGAIGAGDLPTLSTTVNGQTCTVGGSDCDVNTGAAAHSVGINQGASAALTGVGPGTTGQILRATTSADPQYIDFPDNKYFPAAICVNSTAAQAWSASATPAATCRAGTNNKDAFLGPWGASDVAYFKVQLPADWDTNTDPYLLLQIASTDATNSHTIIMQESVSCSKEDGSTTDDVAFNAARSLSTVTLNGNANRVWDATLQLNSTDMTGCAAPSVMWVKISRGSDSATNVEIYGATLTIPRLLVVQAN